jgi:hypothetical protein
MRDDKSRPHYAPLIAQSRVMSIILTILVHVDDQDSFCTRNSLRSEDTECFVRLYHNSTLQARCCLACHHLKSNSLSLVPGHPPPEPKEMDLVMLAAIGDS